MSETIPRAAIHAWLLDLQDRICDALGRRDGTPFDQDEWQREAGGGGGSRVLSDGALFERAGVNFSHVMGDALPPSASAQRPELADRPFEVMGVSLVVHPRSPYVPTSHMNVRVFIVGDPDAPDAWWFGGGFDLTPYYPFEADCMYWNATARRACRARGDDAYREYKRWWDEYFNIRNRNEAGGMGGLV